MASSKRQQELARLRTQRQTARRASQVARRRRRTRLAAGVVAVVVLVAAAVALAVRQGGDDDAQEPVAAGPGLCTWTDDGEGSRAVERPPTDPVGTPAGATMETDQGTVAFSLDTAAAPCASASLASLAAQGFYDDTPCHRLTSGSIFVLQCGDPTGTGTGGPGYSFAEEGLVGATYPRGTVAMAKETAPGTTGSQFFLVYADSSLPPDYTPVGTITAGLDVLDAVAAAGSEPAGDGAPLQPVQVTTLRAA